MLQGGFSNLFTNSQNKESNRTKQEGKVLFSASKPVTIFLEIFILDLGKHMTILPQTGFKQFMVEPFTPKPTCILSYFEFKRQNPRKPSQQVQIPNHLHGSSQGDSLTAPVSSQSERSSSQRSASPRAALQKSHSLAFAQTYWVGTTRNGAQQSVYL